MILKLFLNYYYKPYLLVYKKDNIKDLAELPKKVINSIEIIPVQLIDEVFEHGLEWMPDESNRNKDDSNLKVHQKMVDEKSSGAFKH